MYFACVKDSIIQLDNIQNINDTTYREYIVGSNDKNSRQISMCVLGMPFVLTAVAISTISTYTSILAAPSLRKPLIHESTAASRLARIFATCWPKPTVQQL